MLLFTKKIRDICALPGHFFGWLIFPLIIIICVGVIGAKLGFNKLISWEVDVFLLGDALTLNSLLDFQWYIFSLIVLFGGVCCFIDDQNVKVDLFSNNFSPRTRIFVSLLGDIIFLTPLLLIIMYYGSKFAYTSFISGEGSTYGGLQDRWIIKACLPISASIFMVVVFTRVVDGFSALIRKPDRATSRTFDHD